MVEQQNAYILSEAQSVPMKVRSVDYTINPTLPAKGLFTTCYTSYLKINACTQVRTISAQRFDFQDLGKPQYRNFEVAWPLILRKPTQKQK